MKALKITFLCSILTFVSVAFAAEVTDTLQNGLDGYTGCADAYIISTSTSSNYGTSADLLAEYKTSGS